MHWTYNRELNYVTDSQGDVVCENIAATHPAGHVDHTPQSDARGELIAAAPELRARLAEAERLLLLAHDYVLSENPKGKTDLAIRAFLNLTIEDY